MEVWGTLQASGINDPLFRWEVFGLAPTEAVWAALDAIHKRNELVATYQSVTPAKIGLMFAGSDSKLTIQDLLPFADKTAKSSLMSAATAEVLRKLVQRNSLPDKVIAALSKEINSLGSI